MSKQALTYDSRDMRYHGTQSDGTAIQIDEDAFHEAVAQRETDNKVEDDTTARDLMYAETADPDGWHEDMAGWIPAEE